MIRSLHVAFVLCLASALASALVSALQAQDPVVPGGVKDAVLGKPKVDTSKEKADKGKAETSKVNKSIKLETPTEKKATEIEGTIAEDDPVDPDRNQPCKRYKIDLEEGMVYAIEMSSGDLDSYLRLVDVKGKQLAADDDFGGDLNARIVVASPAKGTYHVVATSYEEGLGDFKLKVIALGKATKFDAEKVHETPKGPLHVAGQLTAKDFEKGGKPALPGQVTQVKLAKGKTYVIDLVCNQCDAFLRLEDAKKKTLAENDDFDDTVLHSRITYAPTEDGVFRLIATSLDGVEGPYVLIVREES